jgi:hypothetical protein
MTGEKGGVPPQADSSEDETALHEHAQMQAVGHRAAG